MTPTQKTRRVAVIGAGPAGLAAAEPIATAGHAVTVYDRMPSPARKFLMAGRGGLNLTHSEPLDRFLARYGPDANAVQSAVSAFPPSALIAWIEGLGQATFIGSSGRVFPRCMKASPILRALLSRLASLGVGMKMRHEWTGFDNGGGITFATPTGTFVDQPDALILALGGASWPKLGSNGKWTAYLEDAGIEVAPLAPSNCGIVVKWTEHFAQNFSGKPLKRIAVSVDGAVRRGEAVITRSGLEGGVIYALGPAIRKALNRDSTALITIDLRPDITAETLTEHLSRPQGSQSRSNFLRKTVALDPASIALLRENGPLPVSPQATATLIKSVPLPVIGLSGLDRAISTAGGVRFEALTPGLMLRLMPGVFVAGEMLDWDAPTGGYLLQASFATAQIAARGTLSWLDDTARNRERLLSG